MKVTGTASLSADRATVWRALNDPAVLVRTIPGCQRLEAQGDDVYWMRVSAGVGSIKGVYDGQVRITDQQEPGSFRMYAQGAGAPGTIATDVNLSLEESAGGGTTVTYDADARVGGMVGGVGQRMLAGVSKRMAAEFFANVDTALVGARTEAGGRTDGDGAQRVVEPVETTADGAGVSTSSTTRGESSTTRGESSTTRGQVFTAPARERDGSAFARGVAVGAAAALVGAVVGAWIRGWVR